MALPPHYSPSVRSGDFIFTSGQIPLITREPLHVPEGIRDQTRLVLKKVEIILNGYGLSKQHIIKTSAFIVNMDDWNIVNEVYAEFFGAYKPARSVLPVTNLHFGCLIELEAIASFTLPVPK